MMKKTMGNKSEGNEKRKRVQVVRLRKELVLDKPNRQVESYLGRKTTLT